MRHAIGWHIIFAISVAMWQGLRGEFDPERIPLPGSPEQQKSVVIFMIIIGLGIWFIHG